MNGASSHKINNVAQVQGFLNLNGYQNCFLEYKVTIILLNWCISPMGGVASVRAKARYFNGNTYVFCYYNGIYLCAGEICEQCCGQSYKCCLGGTGHGTYCSLLQQAGTQIQRSERKKKTKIIIYLFLNFIEWLFGLI